MSLYSDLKAFVRTKAYTNGNNEITGQMVQDALISMITSLGTGYQYMGVATTSTDPGTPDQKVFYLASAVGTYSNFGGLTVADGEFVVLYYDSSWHKAITGAATKAAVDQLGHKIDGLALGKFYGFFTSSADLPAGDDPGYAYVGASSPFAIYVFNNGAWSDSGSVYEPAEGNGEDIDTNAQGKLQFANRGTTYGMGYKILRRDATFASQVGDSDTIYEIRYDFDLGGGSVTIPSGSVLHFNGGKIMNGTIVFNNTKIEGYYNFSSIVSASGGIKIDNLDMSRFSFTTDAAELRFALECFGNGISTILPTKTYTIDKTDCTISPDASLALYSSKTLALLDGKNNLRLYGNGTTIEILNTQNSGGNIHSILCLNSCSNVHISGISFYGGYDFTHGSYTAGYIPIVCNGSCSYFDFDIIAEQLNVPFIYGSYNGTTDSIGLFQSKIKIHATTIRYGIEIHGATQCVFDVYCIGGHRGGYYDMLNQCIINFEGKDFKNSVGVLIRSGILSQALDADQKLRGCNDVLINFHELGSTYGVITDSKVELANVEIGSYDENTAGWGTRNYAVYYNGIRIYYTANLDENVNYRQLRYNIGANAASVSPYDVINSEIHYKITSSYSWVWLPPIYRFLSGGRTKVYVDSNIAAYYLKLYSTDNKDVEYHLDGKNLTIQNSVPASFTAFISSQSATNKYRIYGAGSITTDTIDASNLFNRIDFYECLDINARTVELGGIAAPPCSIRDSAPSTCVLTGYFVYCAAYSKRRVIMWNGSAWVNVDGTAL